MIKMMTTTKDENKTPISLYIPTTLNEDLKIEAIERKVTKNQLLILKLMETTPKRMRRR